MTIFEFLGTKVIRFLEKLGLIVLLFFQTVKLCFQPPFEFRNILDQMVAIGFNSLGVAAITSLFTGMVLALQSGITLESKMEGISQYMGAIVCIPMIRELVPVLTALVVAGRMGSAMAAEIGTMQVTEQIDALVTLATNPVKYLAVPRFIACLVMLPLLTICGDAIGVMGGYLVATVKLNITSSGFTQGALEMIRLPDIFSGIIKTIFFGAIIAMVSCHEGFKTSGGAEGVGRATTKAVVLSFMGILISDYFLTALLF